MVYDNPHKIGYYNPLYTLNNHQGPFFIAQVSSDESSSLEVSGSH